MIVHALKPQIYKKSILFFFEKINALIQLKARLKKDIFLKPNYLTSRLVFILDCKRMPSPDKEPKINSFFSPLLASLDRLFSAPPISLDENKINVLNLGIWN